MGKKPTFTSVDLSNLIDESIKEADQVSKDLESINDKQMQLTNSSPEDFDDYLQESSKTWSEASNVIDKMNGDQVSFNYVYKKICDLIDTGNASLQMLQSIDLDVLDPSMLNATGTLIQTIRGCIAEFTKIHQQWIKFNHTLHLEEVRFQHKKDLMKYQAELNNGVDGQQVNSTELIDVKSSDLVEFLQWKKEKKEKEMEQANKI